MKTIEDLHEDLVVALGDYLDNQESEDADIFYHTYFQHTTHIGRWLIQPK